MHFPKYDFFFLNNIGVCSQGSYRQSIIFIGPCDGLVPHKRKAINWTNDDAVHIGTYAAPDLLFYLYDRETCFHLYIPELLGSLFDVYCWSTAQVFNDIYQL